MLGEKLNQIRNILFLFLFYIQLFPDVSQMVRKKYVIFTKSNEIPK